MPEHRTRPHQATRGTLKQGKFSAGRLVDSHLIERAPPEYPTDVRAYFVI
jgi:hypothetical protein